MHHNIIVASLMLLLAVLAIRNAHDSKEGCREGLTSTQGQYSGTVRIQPREGDKVRVVNNRDYQDSKSHSFSCSNAAAGV